MTKTRKSVKTKAINDCVNNKISVYKVARKYHMSITTVTRWLKEVKTIDFEGKKISVKDYMKLLKAAAVLLGQRWP